MVRRGPIVVARKWVDRRPQVDSLTGAVRTDPRSSRASDADDAALEWALRLADGWDPGSRRGGDSEEAGVVAVTAGPPEAAAVLIEAVALGARAIRVDLPEGAPSRAAAGAVAAAARAVQAAVVICGDLSLDGGSGSVPAFVAAELGWAQALGLVEARLDQWPDRVKAVRRLDGGRRERLAVPVPCVLSVEGATARLRRAPVEGVLSTARRGKEAVEVLLHPASPAAPSQPEAVRTGPFRPRTRVVPPPPAGAGPRLRTLALTGALVRRTPARTLVLDPDQAAEHILAALREWGELR